MDDIHTIVLPDSHHISYEEVLMSLRLKIQEVSKSILNCVDTRDEKVILRPSVISSRHTSKSRVPEILGITPLRDSSSTLGLIAGRIYW